MYNYCLLSHLPPKYYIPYSRVLPTNFTMNILQLWWELLDNLTKGSSGQALQNANLMLGEDEAAGLMMAPLFP